MLVSIVASSLPVPWRSFVYSARSAATGGRTSFAPAAGAAALPAALPLPVAIWAGGGSTGVGFGWFAAGVGSGDGCVGRSA